MTQVAPILGRSFTKQEDRPGGPPVVVLSAELWKRSFASDPNILGQPIRLDGVAYTVIGVMPAHFDLWGGELWIPLQLNPSDSNRTDRRNWIITVLHQGVTEQAANARLAVLAKELEEQYGATMPDYRGWDLRVWNVKEAVKRQREARIAGARFRCGTVDSGFLRQRRCSSTSAGHCADARDRGATSARRGPTARTAADLDREPGALTYWRHSRVLAAIACLPLLVHLIPEEYLDIAPELIRINPAVLAIAAAIAVVMGALFGIVPAWQASRQDLVVALKEGSGKIGGDRAGRSVRDLMVVVEIALSLIVLAGAALMVQS